MSTRSARKARWTLMLISLLLCLGPVMAISNAYTEHPVSLGGLAATGALEWSIESVDGEGLVESHPSLALDDRGNPSIGYYHSAGGELRYALWNGEEWDVSTVDDEGDVGKHTSLALDAKGSGHMSYYDISNRTLKYARWSGREWSKEFVEPGGGVGEHSSLALDADDHAHIAYYNSTGETLRYARKDGDGWNITAVDSGQGVGMYASLALDADDHAHMAYYDPANGTLKYARWDGAFWSIETVDDGPGGIRYASLALDGDGHPHIAYHDSAGETLRYATGFGDDWAIETVDTRSGTGAYPSIAVDAAGHVHVVYYDATTGDLEYARAMAVRTEQDDGEEGGIIADIFLHYSPAIWGGLLLVLIALYLNLYLDKFLMPLKIKGSRFVTSETFDFAANGFKAIITGVIAILFLFWEYVTLDEFKRFWSHPFAEHWDPPPGVQTNMWNYMDTIVLIPIIFFLFILIDRVIHNVIQAKLKEPGMEERDSLRRGISIGGMTIRYTLYSIAVLVSVLLVLTELGEEQTVLDILKGVFFHTNEIALIFALLIVWYILERIILLSIIRDLKRRDYSPQLLEGIRVGGSWTIRGFIFPFMLYTILVLFGLQNIGDVFVAFLFLIIVIIVVVVVVSPLRNMLSGVVIFSNRPFDVGDRIRIMDGVECDVEKQTLLFTHVRTRDGQPLIVPNEKIMNAPIVNISKSEMRFITLSFDFHSSIPNKKIKSLLVKSAFSLKEVSRRDPPKVSVTDINGDILSYQLVIGIKKKRTASDVRSKLLCRIQEELLKSNIKDPLRPEQHPDPRNTGNRGGGPPKGQ